MTHDPGRCPVENPRQRQCRCACPLCWRPAEKGRLADSCVCRHCITNKDSLALAHGGAPTIATAAHPTARKRRLRGWAWPEEGWCRWCERIEPLVRRLVGENKGLLVLASHKAGKLGASAGSVYDGVMQQCPGSGRRPAATPTATARVPDPPPEADEDAPDYKASAWIG